jgi:hypothetical protein
MIKVKRHHDNRQEFDVELSGVAAQIIAEIAVAIKHYARECEITPLEVAEGLKKAFEIEEAKNADK